MDEKKQIEEMAKDICRVKQSCNDACHPINSCRALKYAERFYDAGYRKQSVGGWQFATNHYFNDYGDLKVYATASCSECENAYPFNPTVASEFIERPETLSAYEDWNIDVEPIEDEVLKQAKANKNLYPFCPNCGARMKGEQDDNL